MTSDTLREKHPQMRRPHMKDGTLTDMGEDPGPGRCPKGQEIDIRKAADTPAYRKQVEKTRQATKDPSRVKAEALKEAQKEAKSG